jgi:O-antigen/teichoic acid export membrane protein
MYTARYLGAEGFGILSFALAFAGIFGIFTDVGLRILTVREVARDKSLAEKYLGNIVVMKIILSIITIGLIGITINLLGYPLQTIKVVYLISLSIVFSAFSGMFYSIFQAYEKMEYQSLGQILSSVLMLGGALFAISEKFDVIGFASIYFAVSTIILGYSFVVCAWKFVLPKIKVDLDFWKSTLKEALPFGLTGIFVTIYYWIDSIMLSLMQGDEAVGWYNAAYRLIMVLLFIPSILNMVIFPAMSRFFITSKESLRFAYEKYFKYMAIVGIPLGLGTTLLADRIILLIFGAEYINSVIALQILVWSSVFIFLNGAFARLLEASNYQMTITKITGICMVENVVLNLIIIPKFSYIGASATTVITEFTALILCIIVSSNIGYNISKNNIINALKVVIASLVMGLLIINSEDLNSFFLILASIALYFSVLYLLKGFSKDDVTLLMAITNKTKL